VSQQPAANPIQQFDRDAAARQRERNKRSNIEGTARAALPGLALAIELRDKGPAALDKARAWHREEAIRIAMARQ
jgi:hypothetical protein